MIEANATSELYWQGGLFNVFVRCQATRLQNDVDQAIKVLEEFRLACQKQYIAFNRIINGRPLAYKRLYDLFNAGRLVNRLWIGNGSPFGEQLPGQSSIASITQAEVLEGLRPGGDFDNQHAKAVIVFIYHLWDESCRVRIAENLRVEVDSVTCDLMGDLREVRNAIIHNNSTIEEQMLQKLKFLPGIWQIEKGELVVTGAMLHSLMEQLNAIRVDVTG